MSTVIFNGSKFSGSQLTGEKLPGDLAGWNTLGTDANKILTSSYGELSKRSATLYHTYGPAGAAVDKQVDYAVGPGLVFRSRPDFNALKMSQENAFAWGRDFQKIINYYFTKTNFYQKQNILFRTGMITGDSLLLFLRENNEIDLIEYSGDQIDYTKNDGDYLLGIKKDKYLRRTGIYFTDGVKTDFKDSAGNQNLIQFYIKTLARQLRGYPLLYKIINLAKNDDRHTDAIVQRAVLESIILGTSNTEKTNLGKQVENLAKQNKARTLGERVTDIFKPIGNSKNLGAGNILQMRGGEDFKFTELKAPGNSLAPFKTMVINYIAMATGTPPEVMLSKYESSFTAHKGALNDFMKSYMYKRAVFRDSVMIPTIREFSKDAIIKGYIKAPGFFENPMIQYAYLQGSFMGPIPGTINPLQEVNAKIKQVESGFITRSDAAAYYGNDFDNMINEWGKQEEEFYKNSPEKQAEIIQKQEAGK